ncbi:mitochondrial substrate carrier family protein ancA-like isoform X2 [Rhodnius prolixus]|uniref:mitochondrial substrate carrier family protein ancA-like isoform X2 n=1 Tax=Rhodnius prolixus TaxID=13249 RepID=UPI003D18C89B
MSNDKKYKTHGLTKFIIDFVSSGIGGVVAKTVVAPLDRVKLVLQSLMFGFHKYIITLLTDDQLEDMSARRIAKVSMLAGSLSASITLTLTYQLYFCQSLITGYRGPIEKAKYSTITGCLHNVHKKEGLRGWFNGFYTSQIAVIVNRALFFGLYDLFKFGQTSNLNLSPTTTKLIAAQTSSIISSFAAYPVETVARRIIAETGRSKKIYGSTKNCFRKIYIEEGIKGFFGGALINMIRSIGGAIVLLLHDEISNWMLDLHKTLTAK